MNFLIIFVILFVGITYAFSQTHVNNYLSNEKIIESMMLPLSSYPEAAINSKFSNPFFIPTLNQVIPEYMQKRLRLLSVGRSTLNVDNLKNKVDLRFRDSEILSQVGGRCSAYGLISAIENILNAPQIAQLSKAHLWSAYRRYSSVRAVDAAKRMFITEEKSWPHKRLFPFSGWREKRHTKLEYITFIGDDVGKALKAMNENRPIYLGLSVTKDLENCLPILHPGSPDTGGGHAVSISGYTLDSRIPGGGYFIIKNSWGKNCGDNGYHYMPFHYCTRGGRSYCIMWDVQGVVTRFPSVPNVIPEVPNFNLKNINVRISSYKSWYHRSRSIVMEVEGDSLHIKQVNKVSLSVDGENFRSPVLVDIDNVKLTFRTNLTNHQMTLKFYLKDGQEVLGNYKWHL